MAVAKGYIEYDGKRIEVDVTNIEISYSHDNDSDFGGAWRTGPYNPQAEIEVTGRLVRMDVEKKEEPAVCPRQHWWGGVDMASGKDSMAIHYFSPRSHGKSYFQNMYLNGNWDYPAEEEVNEKEEETMGYRDEDSCAKSCDDSGNYGGERLALEIKDLDLDDEQRKLLKYGLVDRNGLITQKGESVLMNHLLEAYADEIVENLDKLEESRQPKKVEE